MIATNDRRSIARTRIDKGGLLFFGGQNGVRSCCVTDITSVGAGIRSEDLPALPQRHHCFPVCFLGLGFTSSAICMQARRSR